MQNLKIIRTEDGSDSVFNEELNESYHSVHGAVAESKHVFIKNGFRFIITEKNPAELAILEIGLGTGLNVLLTWQENRKFECNIHYTAIEAYPLPGELVKKLNYVEGTTGNPGDSAGFFHALHNAPWNEFVKITDRFYFRKLKIRYEDYQPSGDCYDLVYYDAFSPGRQPELWEVPVLQKTAGFMCSSAVLVTYTAKGQLKRDLRSVGLTVETLQGPPGKKEMIRAIRISPHP
ncbi:MAG TPA: tRNA (5-methylaminomethyl-2-thiouridine)(34)-methyltransferase MnmD [Cyclobacteriaceae bacterium]|nr:tRNA (5-methylaminomethyl-2-thiouridine)(34)-methyltransferase MnmD [Cyclobacteriaceae bacterium]